MPPGATRMADGAHDFSAADIDDLLENVDMLSDEEAEELYKIVDDLATRQRVQRLRIAPANAAHHAVSSSVTHECPTSANHVTILGLCLGPLISSVPISLRANA